MVSVAERRLTAIVAADLVGYSRLIETNEARTLGDLKTLRKQVIGPLVAENRGRNAKLWAMASSSSSAPTSPRLPRECRFRPRVTSGLQVREFDGA